MWVYLLAYWCLGLTPNRCPLGIKCNPLVSLHPTPSTFHPPPAPSLTPAALPRIGRASPEHPPSCNRPQRHLAAVHAPIKSPSENPSRILRDSCRNLTGKGRRWRLKQKNKPKCGGDCYGLLRPKLLTLKPQSLRPQFHMT